MKNKRKPGGTSGMGQGVRIGFSWTMRIVKRRGGCLGCSKPDPLKWGLAEAYRHRQQAASF